MTGLSPRQHDCLKLVWERQATSKEIGAELGISKWTVDGYLKEAIEVLGARDRRHAAAIAFGAVPRSPPTTEGADIVGVGEDAVQMPSEVTSTKVFSSTRPWRTHGRRNAMTLGQTLGWIAIIAFGSIAALSLAASVGDGLPSIAVPVLNTFDRLSH